MTLQTEPGDRSVPPAEAIDDFADLYPRPTGLNRFSVLSLASDGFTAYSCNIDALECECRDKQFNRDEGEICKHIAAALFMADSMEGFNDQVVKSLSEDIAGLHDRLDDLAQKTTAVEAEAKAATAAANGDEPAGAGDDWNGDPVAEFESLLRDDGLDPDDFEIWVDDQFGSLQVDLEGYLDSDEFDTWVELSNGLDMGFDADSDHNYLQADRFPEVFG